MFAAFVNSIKRPTFTARSISVLQEYLVLGTGT